MRLTFSEFAVAVSRKNGTPTSAVNVATVLKEYIVGATVDRDTIPDVQTVDIVQTYNGSYYWVASGRK